MALTKEKKQEIHKEYGQSKSDCGSPEVQIATLTERINGLAPHFKANTKDHHSRFGLIRMVSRRKKLLSYVKKQDPKRYADLISRLNLRK